MKYIVFHLRTGPRNPWRLRFPRESVSAHTLPACSANDMAPVNLSPMELAIGRDKLVTLVAESNSNVWLAESNTGTPSAPK